MTNSNRITKIAVVGAGGHCGSFITEALLATGLHEVTDMSRIDSTSNLPGGVRVVRVDYGRHGSLVAALTGHDALVITFSGRADFEVVQRQLTDAAIEAEVRWIMPNE